MARTMLPGPRMFVCTASSAKYSHVGTCLSAAALRIRPQALDHLGPRRNLDPSRLTKARTVQAAVAIKVIVTANCDREPKPFTDKTKEVIFCNCRTGKVVKTRKPWKRPNHLCDHFG